MHDPLTPCAGCVQSADIAVPEHAREVRFYAEVLGTGEAPLWRADLMNNLGLPIIGLGERVPEYEELPLQWMPHIQVEDVAAGVAAALAAGGEEVMHGKDDDGNSQWAVLLDANGAAFGLVPVVPSDAAAATVEGADGDPTGPMGHVAHLSLTVPDAAATCDFYRKVVGWSAMDVGQEDGAERHADFLLSDVAGRPVASIHEEGNGYEGLPAVWLLHLPVGDLEESLRQVQAEGGEVLKSFSEGPGQGSVAVVRDPVGVCLALEGG